MKRLYHSPHVSPGGNEKTGELSALFAKVRAAEPNVLACPRQDPFPGDGRVRAIRFSGLSFQGKENPVFAYIGFPKGASAEHPVPGMVLVHGGGGHAYAEWVQYWVDHGFAAISFDGFGQRYVGADHTYDASLDFWKPDPASLVPMDGFASAGKPFPEQGFTYYVADVLLAHNLLRADPRVRKEQIGLTGISWGGVAASVAVCYDDRFAFAAPVYCSSFMDVSQTPWGAPFRGEGITDVWDAKLLLGGVTMPFHVFNSDCDPFSDANASTACAAAAEHGALTLLHGFTHGQIEGSAIPELLRFAETQVGRGERNIRITALFARGDGAAMRFVLPEDVRCAEACAYYKTEDLCYDGKYLRENWTRAPGDAAGGEAWAQIPEGARLFYFSVEGRDPQGQTLRATTGVFSRETWETAEKAGERNRIDEKEGV